MKKGFTLIELLAVIIILAVIALIATPVVLNVVENAKNEARKNSVRGYADSVRLSYAEEMLKNTGKPLKELATLKTQGSKVDCEYVKYDDKKSGTLLHSCKVEGKGNYCYINGNVYEDGTDECNNIINLIMSDNIPYNTPNIYLISQIPDGVEYAQSKEIGVEYPSLKVVEEKYFIKSSEVLEINAIGKCGTDELPSECIEENVTTIEANTWYQVSGNVTFKANKNMSIEAIIGNNNEYGNKKTYEVVKIDMNNPTLKVIVNETQASIELNDVEGLLGYGINQSTSEEPSYTEVTGTNAIVEWTASEAGNYVACVKDISGRIATFEFTIEASAFCQYSPGHTWEFSYTGDIQNFQVPCDGAYKLEVWGAQGGTCRTGVGGAGGYSVGTTNLEKEKSIYIVVGGVGGDASNKSGSKPLGGYNGGANGAIGTSIENQRYYNNAAGGGATHIGTFNSTLADHGSVDGLYIVAGGGGGGGNNYDFGSNTGYKGGYGGGESAGSGGHGTYGGAGATQTSGNTIGLGAGRGGGGGYYGGKGASYYGGGGGGSSYIEGVINGQTIAGNLQIPTHDGTNVMTGNTGDGFAKITYLSSEYVEDIDQTWEFSYTGDIQEFEAPISGIYKIELYGAQGGNTNGGKGAYTSGELTIQKEQKLIVTIGGQGGDLSAGTAGYNGGGKGSSSAGGGGATDVRIGAGELADRIMVAAGGGGGTKTSVGGAGGTITGEEGGVSNMTYKCYECTSAPEGLTQQKGTCSSADKTNGCIARKTGGGTQTSGGEYGIAWHVHLDYGYQTSWAGSSGTLGVGGNGTSGAGGGGGYYGGGGGSVSPIVWIGGAGGSSCISGHSETTGCFNENYQFTNTSWTAGINEGNGKAIITLIEKK